jgi:hypothetical protein
MIKTAPRFTAAQVILLAADDLMAQGGSEFSEWDLTLAAWNRDRNRFGLRGYAQSHPDHKRVMMEIMGRKPQNPILLGLMEKIRPNVYRLTPLGRAEAARMRGAEPSGARKKSSSPDQYDSMASLVTHPAFRSWREDPDEPRRFADVLDFLGARVDDDPAARLRQLRGTIKAAMEWCNSRDVDYLTKDPSRIYPPIHVRDLVDLTDFLHALTYRFPQLEGKKPKLPKKG